MDKNESVSKNKISNALFWKVFERFGVQGVQFFLQIILARLLDPGHYGILSLMVIFTSLANVFIQNGFNTALIQNKDVTEEDYSSVFWVTLVVASIMYAILFIMAPFIAEYYKMPEIIFPFRVLSLVLFPGAFNSVQIARVSRNMDFKKVFKSNISAIIVSGIVSIFLAYTGAGLWALVAQTLLSTMVACCVMWSTVHWRPRLICNLARIKVLFSYGWKLLVSGLLDTLYQDIRSLVVGKKYDSGTLGYYNRGKQFPQFIIGVITNAVQSVMLPAMSSKQDTQDKVKEIMRNSIVLSSYIIFPMMLGLAAVAEPLVQILLTDKWLPCVPYLQIYCFAFVLRPIHTCNLQAINAVGRSDIFLKLEIIKKAIGMIALLIAVLCFDSPIAIAMTGVFTTWISSFINAYPNKKLIDYSYLEQMKDVIPSLILAVIMFFVVRQFLDISESRIIVLIVQVLVGVVLYFITSAFLKMEAFKILQKTFKKIIKKK